MIRVSVTQARNGLSALLSAVSRGETVLITSRGKPIATLVANGVARPPLGRLDLESFYSGERPRPPDGVTLADLIDEARADRL